MQAKSRLSSSQIKQLSNQKRLSHQFASNKEKTIVTFTWSNYLKLLPTLALGILAAAGLAFVFIRVYPDTIANWGLYHSYIPVLIMFFLAIFLIASFLMQKSRHGLLIAIFLTLLLLFKFQDVIITPILAISLGGSLLLIEAIARLVFKR